MQNKGFIKTVVFVLFILVSSCNYQHQFLRGYYIDTEQNSLEDFEIIKPIVIEAIRKYEDNFGWCKEKITFFFKQQHFACGWQMAAGCVCGGGDGLILCIGVDEHDECMTEYIIMHELYHACKGVWYDDNSWIMQIEAIKNDMRAKNECVYNPDGLYSYYPFK